MICICSYIFTSSTTDHWAAPLKQQGVKCLAKGYCTLMVVFKGWKNNTYPQLVLNGIVVHHYWKHRLVFQAASYRGLISQDFCTRASSARQIVWHFIWRRSAAVWCLLVNFMASQPLKANNKLHFYESSTCVRLSCSCWTWNEFSDSGSILHSPQRWH